MKTIIFINDITDTIKEVKTKDLTMREAIDVLYDKVYAHGTQEIYDEVINRIGDDIDNSMTMDEVVSILELMKKVAQEI